MEKTKIQDMLMRYIKGAKKGMFFYDLKTYFFEEKLFLGEYGYADVFFYKKGEHDGKECVFIVVASIFTKYVGSEELIKAVKNKEGCIKYMREVVGISDDTVLHYSNVILAPGIRTLSEEFLFLDSSSSNLITYDINPLLGLVFENMEMTLRRLNPSSKIVNKIKRRVL